MKIQSCQVKYVWKKEYVMLNYALIFVYKTV